MGVVVDVDSGDDATEVEEDVYDDPMEVLEDVIMEVLLEVVEEEDGDFDTLEDILLPTVNELETTPVTF